jgi:hypothetical protein
MKTSEQTNEISLDLAKAQGVLSNPTKDGNNPHFKSKYATLDTGLNIVRECLSKHNIAVVQATRIEGNILMLDTRLTHKSGQWIEAEYPVCAFPAKQQDMGSALTYSRRYSMFSLVGIAGEEDDDGNAAVSAVSAPKRTVKAEMFDLKTSIKERDRLMGLIGNCFSEKQLSDWSNEHKVTLNSLQPADREAMKLAYVDQQTLIKGKDAA